MGKKSRSCSLDDLEWAEFQTNSPQRDVHSLSLQPSGGDPLFEQSTSAVNSMVKVGLAVLNGSSPAALARSTGEVGGGGGSLSGQRLRNLWRSGIFTISESL